MSLVSLNVRNLALVAALIEAWIVRWPLRLLHTLDKPTYVIPFPIPLSTLSMVARDQLG